MVNVVTTLLITVLYGTLKWIIVKHPALSIVCHMANHQYAFLFEWIATSSVEDGVLEVVILVFLLSTCNTQTLESYNRLCLTSLDHTSLKQYMLPSFLYV